MYKLEALQTIDLVDWDQKSIIYFLYAGEEIIYIGESSAGLSRPFSHTRTKYFNKVEIFKAPEDDLSRKLLEKDLIQKYKPKYNKTSMIVGYVNKYVQGHFTEKHFRELLKHVELYNITNKLRIKLRNGEIKNIIVDNCYYIPESEFDRLYNEHYKQEIKQNENSNS